MSENRLSRETSPYLLQHEDNPVHWWAWGPDALAEAKRTGKPILLSVGYAACHWCHVMAHESFEDPVTAELMNRLFVNIKVDREERPDVDAVYMSALHRLGEQGGWPLTMFLDCDGRPFFGGTYFPPEQRYGRPSFRHVLTEIARTFAQEPGRVEHNAAALMASLAERPDAVAGFAIDREMAAKVTGVLTGAIDFERGGLRGAPKFPQWNIQWLLWKAGVMLGDDQAKLAVRTTLTNICQGGIYDHVGGGFARYSVDDRWLVPHFEKMLYDNALLIDLMTEVWRETQDPLLRTRVLETVDWLQREMIAEGGGFAASLDADSEGEEGKFYVWSEAEVYDVLGPELGPLAATVYDVEPGGNFEGHTILNRLNRLELLPDEDEARLKRARELLLEARSKRIRPGWDDKVLADWNGLMIAALARAATVFEEPRLLALASRAFAFVRDHMFRDGRLMHSARGGMLRAPATSSDYANMIWAAIRLHEATLMQGYLDQARAWAALLDQHYRMPSGGYALSADDTADVPVRLVVAHDDAVPNANAVHLSNLVQLFLATGDVAYLDRAAGIPAAFASQIARGAAGHAGLIASALDLIEPRLIVLLEPPGSDAVMRGVLQRTSIPGALIYVAAAEALQSPPPALVGKSATSGQTTAYLCLGPQCSAPITAPDALRSGLAPISGPPRASPS